MGIGNFYDCLHIYYIRIFRRLFSGNQSAFSGDIHLYALWRFGAFCAIDLISIWFHVAIDVLEKEQKCIHHLNHFIIHKVIEIHQKTANYLFLILIILVKDWWYKIILFFLWMYLFLLICFSFYPSGVNKILWIIETDT